MFRSKQLYKLIPSSHISAEIYCFKNNNKKKYL